METSTIHLADGGREEWVESQQWAESQQASGVVGSRNSTTQTYCSFFNRDVGFIIVKSEKVKQKE